MDKISFSKEHLEKQQSSTLQKETSSEVNFFSSPINIIKKKEINIDISKPFLNINFIAFESKIADTLLVYIQGISFGVYSLTSYEKIVSIKCAHDNPIRFIDHYYDQELDKDYILTSDERGDAKIWDMETWDLIFESYDYLNRGEVKGFGILSDFRCNSKKYVILSSNGYTVDDEKQELLLYDFTTNNLIKKFGDKDGVRHMVIFYDENFNKFFIFVGVHTYIKAYDFDTLKIYKKFSLRKQYGIFDFLVKKMEKEINIIGHDGNGAIRIWDFYTGNLIKEIKCGDFVFFFLSWNTKYLLVNCHENNSNGIIKIIDVEKNKIIDKKLNGETCSIAKIKLKDFGEALIFNTSANHFDIYAN